MIHHMSENIVFADSKCFAVLPEKKKGANKRNPLEQIKAF